MLLFHLICHTPGVSWGLCYVPIFNVLTMKNINKNQCRYVPFMFLDIIFAQWWCPVASSEALDLLHWSMHALLYQRTATTIKMTSKVSRCFCHCFICCCLGSPCGNTEQVVAQWWLPVASGVALDMLHWVMCFVLHQRTAMAIKMAGRQCTFDCHQQCCHRHKLSYLT